MNATHLAEIAKALETRPEAFFISDAAQPNFASLIDVSSKDTQRMLQAFGRIKDRATQRQMVMMIEAIAIAADT